MSISCWSVAFLFCSAFCLFMHRSLQFNSNFHQTFMDWAVDATVSSSPVGLVVGQKPDRELYIRWQIWHSKLPVDDGGPDLRRSRLDSNSWIRRTSNSSTADLHEERQPVLSIKCFQFRRCDAASSRSSHTVFLRQLSVLQ